ncbi:MAG: NUDIX domain-containing protein, partial [Ignavibacterium sp.]|nr:NUDIX domain-containing protein [Ignavibacterium sp.]
MKLATLCYVLDKKTNSTLMIHRVKKENDYHEGKWNGLGGKFEQGESPEECAIREIEEESGLKVKSVKMKGFI